MGFILQFCVRSISSESFERFIVNFTQMSLSVRQCAEPINQVCRLKVNFQGHGIYPYPVCYISPEPFKSWSSNFTQILPSVRLCAVPITQLGTVKVKVTLQGNGISLRFRVHSFSSKSFARISLNMFKFSS